MSYKRTVVSKSTLFKALLCLFVLSLLVATPLLGFTTARAVEDETPLSVQPQAEEPFLSIGTSFPGVTVKAGENVSFDLTVDGGGVPLNVALSVDDIPEGWEGHFEGNGSQVSRVYTSRGEDMAGVTFRVAIPEDAADGDYKIVLSGEAEGGITDTLELDLSVSQTEIAQGELVSQYPELQGPASATFGFNVNLSNNSGKDQSYSLAAKPPEGWQVTFSPAGDANNIASLSVDAGKSQALDVKITPPATVTEGEYVITCGAISAEEAMTVDLTVMITGSYEMSVSTPSGIMNVDAYAEKESPVTLVIANTGTADLNNVTLTSSAPENWTVRFDAATVETIPAGSTAEVIAYVQPGPNVISGDYAASVTATTAETKSSIDLRVAVKTSTLWGVIGIIIIALIVVVLSVIFGKFGRR